MYEIIFERLILNHAAQIFPGYFCLPFKNTVTSADFGDGHADLAIIDFLYRRWWVIEVETIDHSLNAHVVPQMKTLMDAEYKPALADQFSKLNSSLSLNQLKRLFATVSPLFCVIANAYDTLWDQTLSRYGITFIAVEVFRSINNKPALRVSSELENMPSTLLSEVTFATQYPNVIKVERSGALSQSSDAEIQIFVDGQITSWKVLDVDHTIWLIPQGGYPLESRGKYEIRTDHMERLLLVKVD
jgi:hypothetical protein